MVYSGVRRIGFELSYGLECSNVTISIRFKKFGKVFIIVLKQIRGTKINALPGVACDKEVVEKI